MKKITRLFYVLIIAVLFLGACNLPSIADGQKLSLTAAAQTVESVLSATPVEVAEAEVTSSFTPPVPLTLTPIPQAVFTNTALAIATSDCNAAQFIKDVTVPDGTVMTPGQAFTKKWRFKNIGSCAWSGFSLVFDSGDSMGAPASTAIGSLGAGQEIDLELPLTAPAAVGNYRGYFRINASGGVQVAIVGGNQGKNFYVDIKVKNAVVIPPLVIPSLVIPLPPALPPAIAQVILTNLSAEDGFVNSDGTVNTNPNVGDTAANSTTEAFVSFDTSVLPAGANIIKVVVDFGGGHDTLGNPWSIADGCLRAYLQNYGALDAGDFFAGDPTGALFRWCGEAELNSAFEETGMKSVVQGAVGSARLQLRLQFRTPTTNGNNVADMVRLGTMKLIVTFE